MRVYDLINEVFHNLTNGIGIVLNTALIVLVFTHTPQSLRRYSTLIINFAVTDLCACLVTIFVQPSQIVFNHDTAYEIFGPCRWIATNGCFSIYGIAFFSYSHSIWSLTVSFAYRYRVLLRPPPKVKSIVLCLCVVAIPSFLEGFAFPFALSSPEEVRARMASALPDYNLTGRVFVGMLDIPTNLPAVIPIIFYTTPVIPLYAAMVMLKLKINETMETALFSTRTKAMHHDLLMALVYQAIVPIFFMAGGVGYFPQLIGLWHSPAIDCAVMLAVGMVPVCSPLSTLFGIKPYRHAIAQLVCRRAAEVKPKEASSTSDNKEDTTQM